MTTEQCSVMVTRPYEGDSLCCIPANRLNAQGDAVCWRHVDKRQPPVNGTAIECLVDLARTFTYADWQRAGQIAANRDVERACYALMHLAVRV